MMMSQLAVPSPNRTLSAPLAGNGTSGDHGEHVVDDNDDIEMGHKSSQPAKPPRRRISRISACDDFVIDGPSASSPPAGGQMPPPKPFVPLPQMASFSVTADKLPIQDIELNGDVSAKIILSTRFPVRLCRCVCSFVRRVPMFRYISFCGFR